MFHKSNLKVGGSTRFLEGTGGKIELNVEKWSFSQGLSREFSRLSLTHKNALFHTFSDQYSPPSPMKAQITPKKWKNCILDKFQTVLSFFTLSLFLFLGSVSNFIMPSYPVIIEVKLAKILFSELMPIQSYWGKTLGGRLYPLPLVLERLKGVLPFSYD